MELCTSTTTAQAISNFPYHRHRLLATNPSHLSSKPYLPLRKTPLSLSGRALHSRLLYFTNSLPRATTPEETSSEERDRGIALEDVSPAEKKIFSETVATEVTNEESSEDEQTQSFEFLDKLDMKFDSDETNSILLYGGGALVSLWLASVVVGAIDSIPVFPKLMEVVGLGYTIWFSSRYLIFKDGRDELAAKIEELKQQVLGSNDD